MSRLLAGSCYCQESNLAVCPYQGIAVRTVRTRSEKAAIVPQISDSRYAIVADGKARDRHMWHTSSYGAVSCCAGMRLVAGRGRRVRVGTWSAREGVPRYHGFAIRICRECSCCFLSVGPACCGSCYRQESNLAVCPYQGIAVESLLSAIRRVPGLPCPFLRVGEVRARTEPISEFGMRQIGCILMSGASVHVVPFCRFPPCGGSCYR